MTADVSRAAKGFKDLSSGIEQFVGLSQEAFHKFGRMTREELGKAVAQAKQLGLEVNKEAEAALKAVERLEKSAQGSALLSYLRSGERPGRNPSRMGIESVAQRSAMASGPSRVWPTGAPGVPSPYQQGLLARLNTGAQSVAQGAGGIGGATGNMAVSAATMGLLAQKTKEAGREAQRSALNFGLLASAVDMGSLHGLIYLLATVNPALGLVAAIAHRVTTSFIGMVESGTESVTLLSRMSERLGVSTESLQGIRHAAEQSGVSIHEMDNAMQRFARVLAGGTNLSELIGQTNTADKHLQKMGLTLAQLQALPIDRALGVVADGMQRIEDRATRAEVAFALFGRSSMTAMQFTTVLERGSRGLQDARDQLESLGLLISELDAAKVVQTSQAFQTMRAILRGIGQRLAVDVAPVLTEFVQKLQSGLAELMPSLRAFVAALVRIGVALTSSLIEHLKPTLMLLAKFAEALAPLLDLLAKIKFDLAGIGALSELFGVTPDVMTSAAASVNTYASAVSGATEVVWGLTNAQQEQNRNLREYDEAVRLMRQQLQGAEQDLRHFAANGVVGNIVTATQNRAAALRGQLSPYAVTSGRGLAHTRDFMENMQGRLTGERSGYSHEQLQARAIRAPDFADVSAAAVAMRQMRDRAIEIADAQAEWHRQSTDTKAVMQQQLGLMGQQLAAQNALVRPQNEQLLEILERAGPIMGRTAGQLAMVQAQLQHPFARPEDIAHLGELADNLDRAQRAAAHLQRIMGVANSTFESTRTPLENMRQQLADLNELLDNGLPWDLYARGVGHAFERISQLNASHFGAGAAAGQGTAEAVHAINFNIARQERNDVEVDIRSTLMAQREIQRKSLERLNRIAEILQDEQI